MANTKRRAGRSRATGEQLTFKSMQDEVLTDDLCTKCGKHIRTIRLSNNWIDSEYIDAEGRCWTCAGSNRNK